MGWSDKYKKSIDCDNPKGFSQRAHCQGKKKKMNESKSGDQGLRDWFGKSKSSDGKPGWVQLGGKYAGKPCARQPGQTSTPKCGSSKMKRDLSDKEEERARRRKNRLDPNQPEKSGGAKPTNVRTEEMDLQEVKDKPGKGSGKKDACYNKVKSRYSVWPSAYASGALVKCRKVGAANWGNKTEEKDHEYSMARSEISTIISAAKRLKKKMGKGEGELEAWVQSKITKAADYLDTAADYVESGEMNEEKEECGKGKYWCKTDKKCKPLPKGYHTMPNGDLMKDDDHEEGEEYDESFHLDEAGKKCWKGYKKAGTQKLFGKTYNRCVKEDVCPVCGYDPCQCLEGTISEIHSQAHTPHEVPGTNIKSLVKKAVKRIDVDVDGDVDKKDPTTPVGTAGTKRKIHAPHEVPDRDLKKLVKKAVKRIDTDVDGDVDKNDPKAGDFGEFVPTPDGKKRITTTLKKESFTIDKGAHKTAQRREKIRALVNRGEGGEKEVAKKKLGTTAELPKLKEFTQFMEDWQKVNKSDKTDGMSPAAVKAYRRENPGSKLKTAVTGDPKPGSKDAKRRKSFCSRSKGQQDMHNIDCSKTPDKAICKARRRWKC
jgi:hypothetical protein